MPIVPVHRHLLSGVRRLAVPGDGGRFWIGQIMVIVSTILGVYLAANAGFERAVEFDAMINKRTAYHLITALEAELKDNVDINKQLAKDLNKSSINRSVFIQRAQMGFYVWEAMKETEKTFQIPAEVITGVRRYYNATHVLRQELGDSKITTPYFQKRLVEEHTQLDEKVFPVIRNEKEGLQKILARADNN